MGMNQTATRSRQSIDSLARLLAVENISIQHQPVPTAAFDTLSRTLILPIWEDMSQDVYDMLVGHEVGHALFTPAGEKVLIAALDRIKKETKANHGLGKCVLNIIEDARIERDIKNQYPGLRKNFLRGYAWLHGRDFFEIAGKNIAELSILDRINLHYKLGTINMVIPFNAIEQKFLPKIDACESFDDVVDVSIEILKFYKDNRPKEDKPENQDTGVGGQGNQDQESGDDQQQQQQSPSGAGDDGFEDDNDDSENGAGESGTDEQDGDNAGDDVDGDGADAGDDCGASMEDDTDDGESADSEQVETPGEGTAGENEYNEDDGSWGNAGDCTTDNALEQSLQNQTNRDEHEARHYAKNPRLNMENIIVPFTEIESLWDKCAVNWDCADMLRKSWERNNMPTINNMAKQFEMKKSADEYRRTMTTKTGRLDMNRLHAYKTSDDIFLSNSVTADGDNHGLVMFIDWSGSMSSDLGATISQLLNLVYFCKKANVPFEVYAFTSVVSNGYYGSSDADVAEYEMQEAKKMNPDDDDLSLHKFRLLQFFDSSNMNSKSFRRAIQQCMCMIMHNNPSKDVLGEGFDEYETYRNLRGADATNRQTYPRALQLGCTPLNECILAAKDIVQKFQRNTNTQIVNTVFLTDGDSSGRIQARNCDNYRSKVIIKHKRQEFNISGNGNTNQLLRWLEASTGCHVMGFFICEHRSFQRYLSYGSFGIEVDWEKANEMAKDYKSNGFAILPGHAGYDEFYCINMRTKKSKAVTFDELDSDATLTKLKNAFIKSGNSKKASRKIMVRFAEIFAKNKVS
ncbi:MAG: hypothetical protein VYB50_03715 [Candidatus Thermoplasmatota archaeon]|nr:hypothetical protein [Candidatus Thermoplasmatota archaeon]